MTFSRKRRRPPSLRETLARNHAASSFYALAHDKPVPEKPARLVELEARASSRSLRPRSDKPQGPSEHQEQSVVVAWWWRQHEFYGLPHFALFAIPNGGARDPLTGAKLKREGVRRGALDLMLAKPVQPYSGLFIEMKVGDNKPTPDQQDFIRYLTSAGYKACVHWSADSAIAEIIGYLGKPQHEYTGTAGCI